MGSLHAEANEMPLELRKLKLAMQYAIELLANPRNHAYGVVFTHKFEQEFLNSPRTILTFGLRMKPHIQAAGINTIFITYVPVRTVHNVVLEYGICSNCCAWTAAVGCV